MGVSTKNGHVRAKKHLNVLKRPDDISGKLVAARMVRLLWWFGQTRPVHRSRLLLRTAFGWLRLAQALGLGSLP